MTLFGNGSMNQVIPRFEFLFIHLEPIAPASNLPAVLQSMRVNTPLSLSRDANRLQWGIRVPGDPTQTVKNFKF
jgi:methionyl-tRNA synthetase